MVKFVYLGCRRGRRLVAVLSHIGSTLAATLSAIRYLLSAIC